MPHPHNNSHSIFRFDRPAGDAKRMTAPGRFATWRKATQRVFLRSIHERVWPGDHFAVAFVRQRQTPDTGRRGTARWPLPAEGNTGGRSRATGPPPCLHSTCSWRYQSPRRAQRASALRAGTSAISSLIRCIETLGSHWDVCCGAPRSSVVTDHTGNGEERGVGRPLARQKIEYRPNS